MFKTLNYYVINKIFNYHIMGAGILPVAFHNNNFYFLFSREYQKNKSKPLDWRDFGGTAENNESNKQTAIREGWEESDGFLGTQKDIKISIERNCLHKIKTKHYFVYVILIPYDKSLPKKFREKFKRIQKRFPEKITKKGFYEKDKLMWLKLENIPKHMDKFRPWYKKIVKDLIIAFKNFNKN